MAALLLLFWGLRIYYWHQIDEPPFSDLEDYVKLGSGVARSFDFSFDSFWRSYKPPTIPLFHGLVFFLFGDANLDALRYAQGLFVFGSAGFLAREIYIASASKPLAFSFLLIVAVAKSSVFWSYKAGTESLAEGFLYLVLGVSLWAQRAPAVCQAYFALGALSVAAILARPNFVPFLFLLSILPLVKAWKSSPSSFSKCLSAYILAIVLAWSPWITRNYRIYGDFLPLSTQGPYSFIWELGKVAIPGAGPEEKMDVNEIQAMASHRFKSDLEASRFANQVSALWLREHAKEYPRIVVNRILNQVNDRDVHLTKVSRIELFDGFIPLLDKNRWNVWSGFLGIAIMALRYPWAIQLLLGVVPTFVFGALFLGYARMLEPILPMVLSGNIMLVYVLSQGAKSLMKHRLPGA
ncbi:hypothetical protein [Methylogaea oryzae]|uniref:Glycosyltransferase RgtA/B/C/D-like domain-containing protein n=1 Tax=Methylogaea oryzae TaxID=1295382 RepID=A0A8D4VPR7_9GAMM|nr:hypothetical protein [Methylogaea oryzae]BBL70997.1 hypothetical protein MoryE10_16030 [Methylogaea oryzae]